MPKSAQIMGMLVTALMVFGSDLDVMLAVPLGVMAGAIMTFIVAIDERRQSSRQTGKRATTPSK
jgi:hypothetical protein